MQKKKLLKRSKYAKASSVGDKKSKKDSGTSLLEDLWSTCDSDFKSAGKILFEKYIVGPNLSASDFFSTVFERKAFFREAGGNNPKTNFSDLFSSQQLVELLNSEKLSSDTCTVSKYSKGERINKPFWNQSWQADFNNGFSIRLSRPIQTSSSLFRFCALMESYFGQVTCGMNVYWTPQNSQGFAPHYDDVDVFILQVEGSKRWRVYEPDDSLLFPKHPLQSSRDFFQEEVDTLQCTEYVLKSGDMLYLPRGFVHQAEASSGEHSLHLTLSMGFVTKAQLLLRAITKRLENHTECRRNLQFGTNEWLGLEHMDKTDPRRDEIKLDLLKLLREAKLGEMDLDEGMDSVMGDFMHSRQVPVEIDEDEEEEEVEHQAEKLRMESVVNVRVQNSFRIGLENSLAVVRHCMRNTSVFQEVDPRGLEFDLDDGPVLQAIKESTGPFEIRDLPPALVAKGEEEEECGGRIRICLALLQERILQVIKY